jgi:lipopolysaccharide biosynthesis regulator YciM
MEMGKYNEAIASLNYAARDPQLECASRYLIGTIYLRLGDVDSALAVLHQALATGVRSREQNLAVGYEIAHTYEMRGMPDQAAHFFEWLMQVDATYVEPRGSVVDRLQRLRPGHPGQAPYGSYGS